MAGGKTRGGTGKTLPGLHHALPGQKSRMQPADHAYSIELDYKGASPKAPGSFGVFAAYRYLGPAATLYTTHRVFGGMREGDKGWEVGASYTFAPNILGTVRYFSGKRISLEDGVSALNRSALFSELTFFF